MPLESFEPLSFKSSIDKEKCETLTNCKSKVGYGEINFVKKI